MVIKISIYRCLVVICVVTGYTSVTNGSPRASCADLSNLTFPYGFLFGAGTSAYQIEGAWNEGGKGTSWLDSTYQTRFITPDNSNGNIACDSYYRYEEDIEIAKELKLDYYKFSISWSRILPTGFLNEINQEGVDYYNKLIDGLLAAGIEPWVTIYHFDIPQSLIHMGGWDNPRVVDYITSFADLLFSLFGDRVKTWLTINDPISFCVNFQTALSREDGSDPFGITEYTCSKNTLIAHAKIYHLYSMKYKKDQGGFVEHMTYPPFCHGPLRGHFEKCKKDHYKMVEMSNIPHNLGRISLVLSSTFPIPASSSIADVEAAERARLFEFGIYAHPLVFGRYPQVVMDTVRNYSTIQGYRESRLPDFRLIEELEIKGAYDFIAVNHYSSKLTTDNRIVSDEPNFENDIGVVISTDSSWENSSIPWLKVYPEGFKLFLNWIKDTYDDPEIAVIEQGFPDNGELNDEGRINYYQLYLSEALKAIHEDGVRLIAYTAWSLMDTLEWFYGYTVKFGLYHVDFDSPTRTRTAKDSVSFFRNVIETKRLFETCPT